MIGVFGGTFDPVHLGHLRPALEVVEALDLERIHLVPLSVAVHRPQPVASVDLRLRMLAAAVEGLPQFVIDERELRRDGGSYTLDTLRSIRAEVAADARLCLLVGSDAFSGFASWRAPEEILRLAHVVVMRRPGEQLRLDSPGLGELVERHWASSADELRIFPTGRIWLKDLTQLDVSSSDIRERLAGGRSVRWLVPEAVLEILQREQPYVEAGADPSGDGSVVTTPNAQG